MVLQRDETGSDLRPSLSQATEIEYGFTKNMGNYQSERLSIRLEIEPDQAPSQALELAREWVNEHLTLSEYETNAARSELTAMRREKLHLERSIEEAKERYGKLKEALKKLGLTPPDDLEELPF